MAKTRFDKQFRRAFVVDEMFFSRLDDLCQEYGHSPSVTVWLSDASSIADLTIEELLRFPSLATRQIQRMQIEPPYGSQPRMKVELWGKDLMGTTVDYTVEGDDKSAKLVSGELDKLLHNAFAWYSFISPSHAVFWVLGLVSVVYAGVIAIGVGIDHTNYSLIALGLGVLALPPLYLLSRLFMFPIATIKIGDGKIRADHAARRRAVTATLFFLVIGVGIVVHLVGTGLYQMLFGPGH
jgi:hypothetical protein